MSNNPSIISHFIRQRGKKKSLELNLKLATQDIEAFEKINQSLSGAESIFTNAETSFATASAIHKNIVTAQPLVEAQGLGINFSFFLALLHFRTRINISRNLNCLLSNPINRSSSIFWSLAFSRE